MAWRKRGEGLALNCTSKGKKAGVEGKTAHFFVSIAYGKGVIACDQFFERLTGEKFADYVCEHFPQIFSKSANPIAKRFVQDGDPVQNSAAAKRAFQEIQALMFSIAARSPDLNPIENLFHLVSRQLTKDAIDMEITSENFGQFSASFGKKHDEKLSYKYDRQHHYVYGQTRYKDYQETGRKT